MAEFPDDPRTVADREDRGVRRRGSNLITWNCGCEQRGERVYLCAYHEGYEAALDLFAEAPDGE